MEKDDKWLVRFQLFGQSPCKGDCPFLSRFNYNIGNTGSYCFRPWIARSSQSFPSTNRETMKETT